MNTALDVLRSVEWGSRSYMEGPDGRCIMNTCPSCNGIQPEAPVLDWLRRLARPRTTGCSTGRAKHFQAQNLHINGRQTGIGHDEECQLQAALDGVGRDYRTDIVDTPCDLPRLPEPGLANLPSPSSCDIAFWESLVREESPMT